MNRYSVDEISRIVGLSSEIASLAVPEIIKEKTVNKTKVEDDLLFLFRESIEKYKKQEKREKEKQVVLSEKESKINWKIISFVSSGFLCGMLILIMIFSKNTMQLNQTIHNDSAAYISSSIEQQKEPVKEKGQANNKGIVYIIQSGKKYHTISCKYIKGKEGVTSLKLLEAIERGLTACSACNPS